MKKIFLFSVVASLLLFTACKKDKTKEDTGENGNEQPVVVAPYFSVSANTKVVFSPGNLQWSATNGGTTATTHAVAGGGTAAGTWRFAPNQWDTIGADNKNISPSYQGWIDLFGWCTSGYDNKFPYMTSNTNTDYGNGENNIAGTNYDWGVYNAIYNPKTKTTDAPGTWRTLTKDEWVWLLDSRSTSSGIRYAKGKVNGIQGLIILPDNWNTSTYALNNTNVAEIAYTSNTINSTDWEKIENTGAVFLPVSGFRSGLVLDYINRGYYWATTPKNTQQAYYMCITEANLFSADPSKRCQGRLVRLVKEVQ